MPKGIKSFYITDGLPFYTEFWRGRHLNDCRYHKFLLLLKTAFVFGVTTKAVPKVDPQQPNQANPSNQLNISVSSSSAPSKSSQKNEVILCFDPAIAANYGIPLTQSVCPNGKTQAKSAPVPVKTVKQTKTTKIGATGETIETTETTETAGPADAAEASKLKKANQAKATAGEHLASATPPTELTQPLETRLGAYDQSMEPVLRSAYGVFQYYGELVRKDTQVEISELSRRRTGDAQLFTIKPNDSGCFVDVNYADRNYCVPNEHSANTKEVLTLLIALVNLSTVRSSLPTTSSVIANP